MRLFRRSQLIPLSLATMVACGDKGPSTGGSGGDDGVGDDTGIAAPDPDEDHDGFPASEDCDDHDYTVNPDAAEVCDQADNNCDGVVDEGYDADGDGHYSAEECDYGDDCDESDSNIHAGADEVPYDGIDQDCDGADLTDVDGDGFDGGTGNDCDDNDATVYPGAEEVPKDGVDQDCDGLDGSDGDGDGYDDQALGGDDCDDEDPDVHPGVLDWMNDGVDADCDGHDGAAMDPSGAPVTVDGTSGEQEYLGDSVVVCDLDEDGLDDIVLSSPLSSSYAGRIGVFYGANSGTWGAGMSIEDADVLITSDDYFLGFGLACADLDGDGHLDLAAGRGALNGPRYGIVTDFGIVLWYGDGSVLPAVMGDARADAELSYDLGAAQDDGYIYTREFSTGDLDGDGADELLVNMLIDANNDETEQLGDSTLWIIPGGVYSGALAMDEQVAVHVASDQDDTITDWGVVDDLDGDGQPELYVGQGVSWTYDDEAGEYSYPGDLQLISGLPTEDLTLADGAWAGLAGVDSEGLGYQARFADVDGDGVMDALITQIFEALGGAEDAGALYLISDVGPTLTGTGLVLGDLSTADLQGQWESGYLGIDMAVVGDVDGDGVPEVLVRDPGAGTSADGRLRLLSGALFTGSDANPTGAELLEWQPESANDGLGGAMAGGDFDGDGRMDPVFSSRSWGYDSSGASTGRVYVYLTGSL